MSVIIIVKIFSVKKYSVKRCVMFIGREKELDAIKSELSLKAKKSAILVYGKRRVGKSTLINEASKSFEGVVINHLCVSSTFEGNLSLLYKSISEALSLPDISFSNIFEAIEFLGKIDKNILLIIDEYPYLKETKKNNEVDSYMQRIIDNLPNNMKLILCGSYITMMKELLYADNPLFGRFSLILNLRDFNYYDAAKFYPELSIRDKIAFYSVFGGSPYVLEHLKIEKSLKENIIELFLPETGLIRSHVENIMLREIQKSFDVRILEALKNGKKRYSEIKDTINSKETGILDKQLKILLDMETIKKTEPINRRNDKKKQFYEISDNLMRFYFSFIFASAGVVSRIGEEQFYKNKVEKALNEFISRRFEGISLEYFHRMAGKEHYENIEDFGSYWYDDPATRSNGEFDCVIRRSGDVYDFYECKYYAKPMILSECIEEQKKLHQIKGITVAKVGFISSSGFAFEDNGDFLLVDGAALYK